MSKIVPVYSEASKQHFVEGFAPHHVTVEGETVLTAPLKIGARLSLLGISSVEALLNKGAQDMTDTVVSVDARVDALVFKLASGQFIKLDTRDFTANFDFKPTDTARRIELEPGVRAVPLNRLGLLHDVLGATVRQENLPETVFVKLAGALGLETSELQVVGEIEWSAPFAEGETAPLELVGYYVDVQRENMNRRPRTVSQGVQDFSASAPTPGDSEVNWTDAAVAQARADAKTAYVAPRVRLEMGSLGVIVLELDQERAPLSVANFIEYVNAGHYDGLLFHRVIPGFMVQAGGFDKDFKQKPAGKELENEATNGLKNVKYSLAMARMSAPHSATAQFFINVADNTFLDHTGPSVQGWGYAVFGKVVEGHDVVDRITEVKTGRKGFHDDVPLEPVVIEQAVLVRPAE